jgi:serine protease Do
MANGQRIHRLSDWDRIVANTFVNDTLQLGILRGSDSLAVQFVVEEYVERPGTKTELGIYVDEIDTQTAREYGLAAVGGIVVTRVDQNSIGARLGIRPGDVILQVGNTRITSRDDFLKAMQNIRESFFIIDRNGLIVQLYFGL